MHADFSARMRYQQFGRAGFAGGERAHQLCFIGRRADHAWRRSLCRRAADDVTGRDRDPLLDLAVAVHSPPIQTIADDVVGRVLGQSAEVGLALAQFALNAALIGDIACACQHAHDLARRVAVGHHVEQIGAGGTVPAAPAEFGAGRRAVLQRRGQAGLEGRRVGPEQAGLHDRATEQFGRRSTNGPLDAATHEHQRQPGIDRQNQVIRMVQQHAQKRRLVASLALPGHDVACHPSPVGPNIDCASTDTSFLAGRSSVTNLCRPSNSIMHQDDASL